MPGYVYILANQKYGTLYIGVVSDLVARVYDIVKAELPDLHGNMAASVWSGTKSMTGLSMQFSGKNP